MKFIHLVPVLGLAGAFGAAHALPASSSHALVRQPSRASVVPPWLVDADEAAATEPAAKGIHAATTDLPVGYDDHAEHAVHVHADHDVHVHADHDVHADHAADPHGADPHAGVYPTIEPEPGLDDEDPYQRVGLEPAPELTVPEVERSRAPNGHRVADVYSSRQKLAGQTLRVRGTVVKLNEGILGQTYLHLRDGSGSADRGDDDLTVTTTEPFQLGETVEVAGELAIDVDVGAGYTYAALLTKATRVTP